MEGMMIHWDWLQYERGISRERSIADFDDAFETRSFRWIV